MGLIKQLVGKFYLETQVKCWISRHYLRDAHEWIRAYNILNDNDPDYLAKSFEAKKVICLRFSLECSLKSLIMSLSKRAESANGAYGVLRRHLHNLNALYQECLSRARGRYRIITPSFTSKLVKIANLGVGIRYDLDLMTAYRRQSPREKILVDGPVSEVILNDSFRKEFVRETIKLYRQASKIHDARFAKHKWATMESVGKVDNYIRTQIVR
jgi:hypothetical protein